MSSIVNDRADIVSRSNGISAVNSSSLIFYYMYSIFFLVVAAMIYQEGDMDHQKQQNMVMLFIGFAALLLFLARKNSRDSRRDKDRKIHVRFNDEVVSFEYFKIKSRFKHKRYKSCVCKFTEISSAQMIPGSRFSPQCMLLDTVYGKIIIDTNMSLWSTLTKVFPEIVSCYTELDGKTHDQYRLLKKSFLWTFFVIGILMIVMVIVIFSSIEVQ